MKKNITSVLLILMLGLNIALANEFQGNIKYKMSTQGQEMILTDYYQNNKSANVINVQGMDAKIIYQLEKKKMYVVIAAQNIAMESDIDDLSTAAKVEKSEMPVKTTQTKTIAGHNAVAYTIETKTGKLTIWKATDFGTDFSEADYKILVKMADPASMSNNKSYFSMSKLGILGVETSAVTIMAQEVSKKTESDDFFNLPAGINVMPMPAMPRQADN